jgi:hypothetical protein
MTKDMQRNIYLCQKPWNHKPGTHKGNEKTISLRLRGFAVNLKLETN